MFKETTSLKTIPWFELANITCILYKRLLWPISALTKDLSMRKKVYLEAFLNRFMLTQANIYLLKFSNRNTRKRCETCSKVTVKTTEWRQWCRSGVFIVNFEHISLLFLVFLLLTLDKSTLLGLLFIIIVTQCDALSPSTKFSSFHLKKVVILQV